MKRTLAVLLPLALLVAAPASALPLGGSAVGSAPACSDPNADGSISIAPSACTLIGGGPLWDGTWSWNASGSGPLYRFTATDGASTSGDIAERNQGGLIYIRTGYGDKYWWRRNGGGFQQVVSPTLPDPPASFITKNGSGAVIHSDVELVDATGWLQPGYTLQILAAPAGSPIGGAGFWMMNSAAITTPNVTIAFDPGAGLDQGDNGVYPALLSLDGDNQTVSGGEFKNSPYGIQIYRGVQNPTITDVFVHDAQDGINSGGTNGITTISHSTVQHGGGKYCGPGQQTAAYCHGIYLPYNNAQSVPPPDTGTTNITDVASVDVSYQGDPFKLRQRTVNLTQVTAGCAQYQPSYNGGCSMNWALDFPCGGQPTISHAVIERGPQTLINGGSWSAISFAEEWPGDGSTNWDCPPRATFSGTITSGSNQITGIASITYEGVPAVVVGAAVSGTGLPGPPYPTIQSIAGTGPFTITLTANATGSGSSFTVTRNNIFSLSSSIVIDDGDSDNTHLSYVVQCQNFGFVDCSATKWQSATISNTVVVLNDSSVVKCNAANPTILGPHVTDGGGNHCYPNRAAAAAALGWSGTDVWGNPCCAFPWLPARP